MAKHQPRHKHILVARIAVLAVYFGSIALYPISVLGVCPDHGCVVRAVLDVGSVYRRYAIADENNNKTYRRLSLLRTNKKRKVARVSKLGTDEVNL